RLNRASAPPRLPQATDITAASRIGAHASGNTSAALPVYGVISANTYQAHRPSSSQATRPAAAARAPRRCGTPATSVQLMITMAGTSTPVTLAAHQTHTVSRNDTVRR